MNSVAFSPLPLSTSSPSVYNAHHFRKKLELGLLSEAAWHVLLKERERLTLQMNGLIQRTQGAEQLLNGISDGDVSNFFLVRNRNSEAFLECNARSDWPKIAALEALSLERERMVAVTWMQRNGKLVVDLVQAFESVPVLQSLLSNEDGSFFAQVSHIAPSKSKKGETAEERRTRLKSELTYLITRAQEIKKELVPHVIVEGYKPITVQDMFAPVSAMNVPMPIPAYPEHVMTTPPQPRRLPPSPENVLFTPSPSQVPKDQTTPIQHFASSSSKVLSHFSASKSKTSSRMNASPPPGWKREVKLMATDFIVNEIELNRARIKTRVLWGWHSIIYRKESSNFMNELALLAPSKPTEMDTKGRDNRVNRWVLGKKSMHQMRIERACALAWAAVAAASRRKKKTMIFVETRNRKHSMLLFFKLWQSMVRKRKFQEKIVHVVAKRRSGGAMHQVLNQWKRQVYVRLRLTRSSDLVVAQRIHRYIGYWKKAISGRIMIRDTVLARMELSKRLRGFVRAKSALQRHGELKNAFKLFSGACTLSAKGPYPKETSFDDSRTQKHRETINKEQYTSPVTHYQHQKRPVSSSSSPPPPSHRRIEQQASPIKSPMFSEPLDSEALVLCGQEIGVIGATKLSRWFPVSKGNLRVLDLSRCWLMSDGIAALAPGLIEAASIGLIPLHELDLNMNGFGDQGAAILAPALKALPLRKLSLAGNRIGVRGASSIAVALQNHKTLARLNINMNKIGDAGFTALIQAVASNIAFSALDASDNSIGHSSLTTLANTIRKVAGVSGLRELMLSYNSVGDIGASAVAQLLWGSMHSKGLTSLALTSCGIGDSGGEALAVSLERCADRVPPGGGRFRLEVRNNRFSASIRNKLQSLGATV